MRIGDQGPQLPNQRIEKTQSQSQGSELGAVVTNKDLLSAIQNSNMGTIEKVFEDVYGISNAPTILSGMTVSQLLDGLDGTAPNPALDPIITAITNNPNAAAQAINELEAEPYATVINPPPASLESSNPTAYKELESFYNFINQTVSGNQDWYKVWTGGTNYEPLSNLSTKQQQDIVSFLQNSTDLGPAALADFKDMQSLLSTYGQSADRMAAIPTNKYQVTVNGQTYDFQPGSMIFGYKSSTNFIPNTYMSDIIDVYNKACTGDSASITGCVNWQQAYQEVQNNPQYQADFNFLKQNRDDVLNKIISPTSSFYMDFLDAVVNTPSIDLSKLDPSWLGSLNNESAASFIWNKLLGQVSSNQQAWSDYFVSQGMTTPQAHNLSVILSTVVENKLRDAYNKLHDAATPEESVSTLLQTLQSLTGIVKSPTDCTSTQLSLLVQMVKTIAPLAQAQQQLNDKVGGFQSTLANDLFGLKTPLYLLYLHKPAFPAKVYNSLVQQITGLTTSLTKAQSDAAGLLKTAAAQNIQVNQLLSQGILSILTPAQGQSPAIPPNFDSTISSMLQKVQSMMDPKNPVFNEITTADTSATALINGNSPATSLAQKVAAADPNLKKHLIGPNQDRFSPTDGTSIWFDTSYINANDAQKSLAAYFQNAMDSGVNEMKFSFVNFDKGSSNTVAALLDETHMTMQQIAQEAQTYGISLSVSVGGEDAQSLTITGDPTQFAQNFYNTYINGTSGVDFDLESAGLTSMLANGQAKVLAFFQELSKLMKPNKQSLQLTLAGDITKINGMMKDPTDPSKQIPDPKSNLEYLFTNPPIINRINLMMYDNGTSYYIDVGGKATWDMNGWVNLLVKDSGMTPEQAMSMLSLDFQDRTPYNSDDSSVTRSGSDSYPAKMLQEIQARTGKSVTDMSVGEAAYQIQQQVEIDMRASFKLPDTATLAPSSWWIDENRVGDKGSGNLNLFPETEYANGRLDTDLSKVKPQAS